jgi:hypothetical protein
MRRRRASVELFEEIRREYEFGVGDSVPSLVDDFGGLLMLVDRWLGRHLSLSALLGAASDAPWAAL